METLIQDIRAGYRQMRSRPALTVVALVTLALGIGANTAVFSVVNSVLLRPLPYPDSDALLRVSEDRPMGRGRPMAVLTNETYHAWLERTTTLDQIAAYSPRAYTLTGRGEARRLLGASVSASLFPMLRTSPALGRSFRADEEAPPGNRVVILSDAAWRSLFDADPAAVGRSMILDGAAHEIVGVMPPGFFFPDHDAEIWTPHFVPPPSRDLRERSVFAFAALARLKPGVSLQQAEAEGRTVVRGLFAEGAGPRTPLDASRPPDVRLIPLKEEMVRGIRPALLILMAVVAIVLLIAVVNLTNLLLARGAERRREIAIRTAIGAGRMRLVRQLLTESLLLAAAGASAGLVLAWALQRTLPALAPDNFPRIEELSLDSRVLAFTLAVTVVSALLFGSAPALQALRLSLSRALGEAAYSSSSGLRFVRGNRTRLTLAIGELGMALLLLVGAGLLAKSFARLIDVKPGYDPANVLTARLTLPPSTYSGERSAQFYDALLEKVSALADVAAAGTIGTLPLSPGLMMVGFDLPSRGTDAGPATAGIRIVSPGYLAAMGLRLLEGRFLADSDRSGSRPVVVVNEAFVRTYFPGESLIGRELPLSRTPSEVVGIVGDVRHTGLDSTPQPEVYVAYRQSDQVRASAAYLVVRVRRDPLALVPALRAVVRSIDPDIPLENVMTMEARLSASVAQPRFYAVLLGGFAALALALAIVGVYGVLAYSVRQRRREIGVRMAVGADAENIVRLVMRQGAAMIATGLAVGLLAAFLTSQAVSTLLFGVTARDPMVFATAVVVLGCVGLLACYLPARNAARIDPLEVLRGE